MTSEQKIAKEIVSLLDYGTTQVDQAASDRLYAARRQAVAVAQARISPVASTGAGNFLLEHLHGQQAWKLPLLLLGVVLAALLLTQQITESGPVEEDALLLGSDLPPEAYLDKGFDAWLEPSSQH
ncbi:MAG TPA: DUF3619 family protein [Methylophilaceae bacterium]|nr:DUF3619 family protein [Methylophilaceae bacterium]HQR60415.1 DUF3619 family protein [Methylophilaceae bacterium]